jgi:hypothetical protein
MAFSMPFDSRAHSPVSEMKEPAAVGHQLNKNAFSSFSPQRRIKPD